ncbi:MAG: farnesyl diphosphate synthase [Clostridia bacterium]|nr:farnesyl diphosphate synthase [Clostridia bacterium]
MSNYRDRIEQALEHYLEERDCPQKTVYRAMHDAVSAGGKRLRPMLTLAACEACGGTVEQALPFACALEMIHTYSLIHDDLPCMDDDDFRRGKPTCHKVYGEAAAVLAGDGLLTLAFETAAKADLPPERIVKGIGTLARLAGADGMIGGQIVDMESEEKEISQQLLVFLHQHKTGALLRASVLLGGIAAGADQKTLDQLEKYAGYLGLAFQIQDDILDVTGTAAFGKPLGSDQAQGKTTFVTKFGLERSRELAEEYTNQAICAAKELERPEYFIETAQKLMTRKQ